MFKMPRIIMAEEKQLYSNASMNILGREDAEDKIVNGVHADGVPVGQKTSDYYFDLPKDLIAQDPCEQRDNCRMLVIDRETGALEHKVFHDIIDYLEPGETLVLNNTKVIPARLLGTKTDTGANVEVLLLNRKSDDVWETLVKPGKK